MNERRIIHIDMDCFYAAIEVRDHPELAGKPVAVGGSSGRGVLTTCNYEARRFGCRSAMPSQRARRLCPQLILMPVRFDVYRCESRRIHEIFQDFTQLVEPLSLDEAYLDVSHLHSEPASVAAEIRSRIRERTDLAASAGIASNKFLAKIASDWNKPDGQFEIRPEAIEAFMPELPVEKIWGVGKRTAEKMHRLGLRTCGDLQQWREAELVGQFGRFGSSLYKLCRGLDDRPVNPDRERKSISTERTFAEDLGDPSEGLQRLGKLVEELAEDLSSGKHADRHIREAFVKLKFDDFDITTVQRATESLQSAPFPELLEEAWERGAGRRVRLIGAGVRFHPRETDAEAAGQLEMF